MKTYRIMVCPGIGDFSWLWSKLSTTEDRFIIEYADTGPERLGAFLNLLPTEKIERFSQNKRYRVQFNTTQLTMNIVPDMPKMQSYSQIQSLPGVTWFVEANTPVEQGIRLEHWMPNIKTDHHYQINGLLTNYRPQNIFIVHLSSFKMEKIWKTYNADQWIPMIDMIQRKTGWMPIFIGGSYDDAAQACFERYIENHRAVNLIGRTDDLKSVLCLIQQSKLFLGCVSSGLTMLANVLYVPSASWWPREKLAQSWPDTNVPYRWFLWKDDKEDTARLDTWIGSL